MVTQACLVALVMTAVPSALSRAEQEMTMNLGVRPPQLPTSHLWSKLAQGTGPAGFRGGYLAVLYRRLWFSAYGHRDWSRSLHIVVSGADLYKPLRYPGGHWLLSQGGRTLPPLLSSFWGTPSPTCVSKLCCQAHLCRCLVKPQLASLLHAMARPYLCTASLGPVRGIAHTQLVLSKGGGEGWLTCPGKARTLHAS